MVEIQDAILLSKDLTVDEKAVLLNRSKNCITLRADFEMNFSTFLKPQHFPDKAVSTADRVRILMHRKSIYDKSGFEARFSQCIESIARMNGVIADALAQFKVEYDSNNQDHVQLLRDVWALYRPGVALTSLVCVEWDEIGFQGQDPSSDLRALGIQGLEFLAFFSRNYPALSNKVWWQSLGLPVVLPRTVAAGLADRSPWPPVALDHSTVANAVGSEAADREAQRAAMLLDTARTARGLAAAAAPRMAAAAKDGGACSSGNALTAAGAAGTLSRSFSLVPADAVSLVRSKLVDSMRETKARRLSDALKRPDAVYSRSHTSVGSRGRDSPAVHSIREGSHEAHSYVGFPMALVALNIAAWIPEHLARMQPEFVRLMLGVDDAAEVFYRVRTLFAFLLAEFSDFYAKVFHPDSLVYLQEIFNLFRAQMVCSLPESFALVEARLAVYETHSAQRGWHDPLHPAILAHAHAHPHAGKASHSHAVYAKGARQATQQLVAQLAPQTAPQAAPDVATASAAPVAGANAARSAHAEAGAGSQAQLRASELVRAELFSTKGGLNDSSASHQSLARDVARELSTRPPRMSPPTASPALKTASAVRDGASARPPAPSAPLLSGPAAVPAAATAAPPATGSPASPAARAPAQAGPGVADGRPAALPDAMPVATHRSSDSLSGLVDAATAAAVAAGLSATPAQPAPGERTARREPGLVGAGAQPGAKDRRGNALLESVTTASAMPASNATPLGSEPESLPRAGELQRDKD